MRMTVRFGVAATSVLLAGCSAAPSAPPRPDPVQACANQLVYWAGEQLRGAPDVGFDYQHMGLTGDQAEALRRIVDRARVDGNAVVAGLATTECAAITAQPTTDGPWGY